MAAISPQCLFIIQMPNRQTLINAQHCTDGWRATFWICSLDFSCIIKVIRPRCPRIHVASACFDPQTRERSEVCYFCLYGQMPLHWNDGVYKQGRWRAIHFGLKCSVAWLVWWDGCFPWWVPALARSFFNSLLCLLYCFFGHTPRGRNTTQSNTLIAHSSL